VFTKPLPSNDRRDIYRHTELWEGFIKYTVEMGTKFHKDWFRHSKVDGGDSQTHRQYDDCISLFYSFKIRKVG
jgi:hypothetical protein